MQFDFGNVPESAKRRQCPSPSKSLNYEPKKPALANKSAKSVKASWEKLYNRLLGTEKDKENEDPAMEKSSEDDNVSWLPSSSSPIPPPPPTRDEWEAPKSFAAVGVVVDPAAELFEKFRPLPGSSPPSTWPWQVQQQETTPSRALRKAESEKMIRTPSKRSKVIAPKRLHMLSPEYVRRSLSGSKKTQTTANTDSGITTKNPPSSPDRRDDEEESPHSPQNQIITNPELPPTSPRPRNMLNSEDFQSDDSDFEQLELLLKKERLTTKPVTTKSVDDFAAANSSSIDSEDDWDMIDRLAEKTRSTESLEPAGPTLSFTSDISLTTTIVKPELHRYAVRHVEKTTYPHDELRRDIMQTELIVTSKDNSLKTILLRDMWSTQTVRTGDIIHIIGTYDEASESQIILTNTNYLLVVNPDRLITCTNVADSFACQRRVILKDRIKPTGEPNKPMLYGNILHAVFEYALTTGDFSFEVLKDNITRLVTEVYDEDVMLLKMMREEALDELYGRIPALQEWKRLYYASKPSHYSSVSVHRGGAIKPLMSISKVVDIEEEIWSPMFGIKGNIDATVQATVLTATSAGVYLAPFELKTSKNTTQMQHRAQSLLYTLLLSDRYNISIQFAILCYCFGGEMFQISSFRDEIRSLIYGRNELARYLKSTELLPPVINHSFTCSKCDWKNVCMVYHKTEGGTSESSGIEEFEDLTEHLSEKHLEFFKRWDTLVAKEASDMFRFLPEIWTMTSPERERAGRGFGNMKISSLENVTREGSLENIGKYIYKMVKADGNDHINCSESHIAPGDMIVVSDESGHVCLASGTVARLGEREVTISVNRRLSDSVKRLPGFNEESNQVFHSKLLDREDGNEHNSRIFRIDKNEFGYVMGVARNNLTQLFVQEGDVSRRELIVDRRAPKFSDVPLPGSFNTSDYNADQLSAIRRVLGAEDYALILGMPGTGKTTTISAIIQILVSQGKSVLLASYTHSAVDNILLKVKHKGFDLLRLGNPSKVDSELHEYLASTKKDRGDDIASIYMDPPVVATTCLGINHWMFTQRKFDYCIVDEASQITLPSCLGPLRSADRFVLVGDHYQLSPLVRNPDAMAGGLSESLFKMLCESHPQAVVNLSYQYRMCEDVMLLSNHLVYKGQLKCGSDKVAKRQLKISRRNALDKWIRPPMDKEKDWLNTVING